MFTQDPLKYFGIELNFDQKRWKIFSKIWPISGANFKIRLRLHISSKKKMFQFKILFLD